MKVLTNHKRPVAVEKECTAMLYSTPEKEGISSANIQAFLQVLEDAQLPMHDVIICRHGKIVFEK